MEGLYRYISRDLAYGVMRSTFNPYICFNVYNGNVKDKNGMWELYVSKYDVCTEHDELVFTSEDYDEVASLESVWENKPILD